MAETIRVEVAWAEPARQVVLPVELPQGATVAQAIDRSGIREEVPQLVLEDDKVGIFGRKVSMDQVLRDGDRVEIYRPLQIDPKDARRAKARAQGRRKTG
jgi:putative ubiquitin-RnfH superfamily antitoxin RatB of RatAB toxin-antitoxin module